jgi:hypothetical protein
MYLFEFIHKNANAEIVRKCLLDRNIIESTTPVSDFIPSESDFLKFNMYCYYDNFDENIVTGLKTNVVTLISRIKYSNSINSI